MTLESNKRYRQNKRLEILEHYGKICKCCGETQLEFLTIDHINNDGAQHRRDLGKGASSYNVWLDIIRNGFPPDFQILCMNCNWAKGKYGKCPHIKT